MVDALGNPLAFFLTAGQAHDLEGALLPQMQADTLGDPIPSSDREGGALDCVQENDNYPSRLCLARPCHHCYGEGSSRPTALSPLILGGHLALRLQLRFVPAINARISADMSSSFSHCSLYKVTGKRPMP